MNKYYKNISTLIFTALIGAFSLCATQASAALVDNLAVNNWATGEPNYNNGECVVARKSDQKWEMTSCDTRAVLLCQNTSNNSWVVRNFTHQFSNQALEACARPNTDAVAENTFRNHVLAAPVDNAQLTSANTAINNSGLPAATKVWLNLRYVGDTQQWMINQSVETPPKAATNLTTKVWYDLYHKTSENRFLLTDRYSAGDCYVSVDGWGNVTKFTWTNYYTGQKNLTCDAALDLNNDEAAFTLFDPVEPNDSGSCVQLYVNSGLWDDTNCTREYHLACFNGSDWKLTPNKHKMAANDSTGSDSEPNFEELHGYCAAVVDDNGVAGSYRFAAPVSAIESIKLQTIAKQSGSNDIWINGNDKKYNRSFIFNVGLGTFDIDGEMNLVAPYWAKSEPNSGSCVAQKPSSSADNDGRWYAEDCNNQHPVACYNPYDGAAGKWEIAGASGASYDVKEFVALCEGIGSKYKFYAPQTLAQLKALTTKIKSAGLAANGVWINANDLRYPGVWAYNSEINNWDDNQPSANKAEQCASINAHTGFWKSNQCTEQLPVACSSGSTWYFTDSKVSLVEYSSAQKACDALALEHGHTEGGYLFAAPKGIDGSIKLKIAAAKAGNAGQYWINGNRLEDENEWQWNARHTKTPLWAAGQPSGGAAKNCAVMNSDNAGSWSDADCKGTSHPFLCGKQDANGAWIDWNIAGNGNLTDFAAGHDACKTLGADWSFAAPTTYNENLAARAKIGGNSQVWINATDQIKESDWLLNSASISTTSFPNWGAHVVASEQCVYQNTIGQLSTTDCVTDTANRSWACTDGQTWKVTEAQGKNNKFSKGHRECLAFGNDYVFAAPTSADEAIKLDFARLQAAYAASKDIEEVWVNMTTTPLITTTKKDNIYFRSNLPFSNWDKVGGVDLQAGEQPATTYCVYKDSPSTGIDNPWRVASCATDAAHYACTNGDAWKVALANGYMDASGHTVAAQKGVDYWSAERGDALCKQQHGPSYYFSAPISAVEEMALDNAIRRAKANDKKTWINYFPISTLDVMLDNSALWFANRVKLNIWQKTEFTNKNNASVSGMNGTADCALLHKDGSETKFGRYSDTSCSNNASYVDAEAYKFACFNGKDWKLGLGNFDNVAGAWDQGFSACEDQEDSQYVFAVPRTPEELRALLEIMDNNSAVWINLNDTANEGQWIANRLRNAWWADGEPSNNGNKDCARIKTANGDWYADKCTLVAAPFACRMVNSASVNKWEITKAEGVWSEGFAACAAEYPGSEYVAPQGFGLTSASDDQRALKSAIANKNVNPWLNLSDQESEGNWRAHMPYSDWGVASLFDASNDCAYLDRKGGAKGTWYADSCKYTANASISRGYSCTNGQQWKIIGTEASNDMRWTAGFAACEALGDGWYYAAPTNGVQNRQVLLAMEIAGVQQLWINAHDRITEGEWQINGPEVNFPPEVTLFVETDVDEDDTYLLKAHLFDDEEQGIYAAHWEVVSNRSINSGIDYSDITVPAANAQTFDNNDPLGTGTATIETTYTAPKLLKEDRLVTFKLIATDSGTEGDSSLKATSETFVTVTIRAPLLAAWTFENSARPGEDVTGHGYDIQSSTMSSAAIVNNTTNGVISRVARLNQDTQLRVSGKDSDPVNGLHYDAKEYVLAFRVSYEDDSDSLAYRGILQKGSGANDRQPLALYARDLNVLSLGQSNNNNLPSNNPWPTRDANAPINKRQWHNVYFVVNETEVKTYVDDLDVAKETKSFGSLHALTNTGDLFIGNVPGANEGFVGLIDDIHIFTRELSKAELAQILPEPPLGEVTFAQTTDITCEAVGQMKNPEDPSQMVNCAQEFEIEVLRNRGSFKPLEVIVEFDPVDSTAKFGVLSDFAGTFPPAQTDYDDPAYDPTDIAFTNPQANPLQTKVSWAANERDAKTFKVTVAPTDDLKRESREIANFKFAEANGESLGVVGAADKGKIDKFKLYLENITPNPAGVFSVGIKDGNHLLPFKNTIDAGAEHEICFNRDIGSAPAATGSVIVNYAFTALNTASAGAHYTIKSADVGVNTSIQQVVFNDGDEGAKCFKIETKPSTDGTARKLELGFTIDPEPGVDALVDTSSNIAGLLIEHFDVGDIGFVATQFTCYEPNSKVAGYENMTCSVAVKRTAAGQAAPNAAVSWTATDLNGYGKLSPLSGTLNWDEFNYSNPFSSSKETQTIDFIITNDDIQNGNVTFNLVLSPVTVDGHASVLKENFDTAQLGVVDVTSPAEIKVTRNKAEIEEGDSVTFTVTRTGNTNTAFDFKYRFDAYPVDENDVPSKNLLDNPAHYFLSDLAEKTMSFSVGGANTQSVTIDSIDTQEDNQDILLTMALYDAGRTAAEQASRAEMAKDDIVGLGSADKAGTDSQTSVDVHVRNTNTLSDWYKVTITDAEAGTDYGENTPLVFDFEGSTVAQPQFLTAIKANIPNRRTIAWKMSLQDRTTALNMPDHNYVRMTWGLYDAAGVNVASWSDGVKSLNQSTDVSNGNAGIFSIDGESSNTNTKNVEWPADGTVAVEGQMRIPFVVKDTNFTLKLTLEASKTNNFVGNNVFDTFVKDIPITVKPLYRRLQTYGGDKNCLRGQWDGSWMEPLAGCGSGTLGASNYYPTLYWTWNPVESKLINKHHAATNDPNQCLNVGARGGLLGLGISPVSLVACTTTSNDAKAVIKNDTDINIEINGSRVCRYTNNSDVVRGGCSGQDHRWYWLD